MSAREPTEVNAAADANDPDEQVSAGAWSLLALLTVMNVINFVDRQLLASFANFIVPDLQLTASEFGLLTGFVFIVFYATAGLFAGALADLFDRTRVIAAALCLWSALTAASGAARNFVGLAIPRVFIGVGESALTPAAMSLLADRFPQDRLGLASGLYYMGVPLGVGLSLVLAGVLGPSLGWRNTFYILGAIGIGLALVMLTQKDKRPSRLARPAGNDLRAREIPTALIGALRQSPALVLTMLGGVGVHFSLGAGQFDQLWLVSERGYDRSEIAIVSGVLACVFGVLGNVFGGLAGDIWRRRTGQSRTRLVAWLLLVVCPFTLSYRLMPPDTPLFWIGMSAGFFLLGAFFGPAFASVQELCPPRIRSTVVAAFIMAMNVIGLGVGITGSGFLVDALKAAGVATPYSWALFTFSALSLVAVPLFWAASPPRRTLNDAG